MPSLVTDLRSGCSPLENQYWEAIVGGKESCFQSECWQSREKVDSCPPKTNSEGSAQPWKFLKRKRDIISANHWDGGQSHCCHPLLHADLWTSCDLSLDANLFTQFVYSFFLRLLKGKLGKRSLWITHSSFLLLWSKERTNWSGKVSCDQKLQKVCLAQRWVEHDGAWFKSHYNIALLKWQEKFLAKSCLQITLSDIIPFLWDYGNSPSSVTASC